MSILIGSGSRITISSCCFCVCGGYLILVLALLFCTTDCLGRRLGPRLLGRVDDSGVSKPFPSSLLFLIKILATPALFVNVVITSLILMLVVMM